MEHSHQCFLYYLKNENKKREPFKAVTDNVCVASELITHESWNLTKLPRETEAHHKVKQKQQGGNMFPIKIRIDPYSQQVAKSNLKCGVLHPISEWKAPISPKIWRLQTFRIQFTQFSQGSNLSEFSKKRHFVIFL